MGRVVFGSASRLAPEKDHESLVRGFARAWRELPHLHLRLAGTGPLLDRLRNLAHAEGVGDAVHFHGQIVDVRAFYEGLDVYVQPSKTEGLPCAVLEAMAMARPVIATDVPGNRDAVARGTTGELIPPASPEPWTAALIDAARRPARAAALGEAGRLRAASRFDVSQLVADTIELLNELHSRPQRQPRSWR
jgi:glycosyltransferase involved in cell wall biosynthesis